MTRKIEIGSIWKASDGRLLRVIGIQARHIGVRNVATKRLSYMQRRYFENENAGVGWWLTPHSSPLTELMQADDAIARSDGRVTE